MVDFISLGLSCQSRMMIDVAGLNHVRGPFDYCITEKQALLRALATKGASLRKDPDELAIYTMPLDGREGVSADGLYFWHDYPLENRLNLRADWAEKVETTNEKYSFLWKRFEDAIIDSSHKKFVVSNSQQNLSQFCATKEEFNESFRFDSQFLNSLNSLLSGLGARCFSLIALVRTFAEADTLRSCTKMSNVVVRYCGELSLRSDVLAASALTDQAQPRDGAELERLIGTYSNGASIERIADDAVRVYRFKNGQKVPWAEGYISGAGFRFAFTGRRNAIFSAQLSGGTLHFSNASQWTMT